MLIALALLMKILCYSALICILVGFIRPVFVLWFMDRSNRLKVLQVYGSLSIVFFALYLFISQFFLLD
ncbi:hypothetical protein QWY93_05210 [Echinicola jeungdonensis]|uniref:NADH dehydrogenase subunit 1 n=1 Tax=Echinicola jeungdonensis TaxID=709343 RepID=A0ABV5J653_9BACT|nr:hypothetical protein [Echinicola jeungdonensis]MDN3668723.1 hypothetical protein [Echinicola jeungdonensis]